MSISDKLRELSSLDKSVDVPSLIREAERLDEKIRSLEVGLSIREGDLNDARETIEAAGENPLDADLWATMKAQRDKAIAKAERLEAQNARLRDLVREAYEESWGELSPWLPRFVLRSTNEYREEYWEKSAAKAALDALDKEGSDA